MSRASEKIQQYVALKPIRFNLMSRFEWINTPVAEGYSRQLSIHLTSLRDDESRLELVLNFQGVRNIRFAAVGLAQPLFEIRDASSQQWDGVSYEVRDVETDTISFLCRDFSAVLRETTA
jgi:hypothetical protein